MHELPITESILRIALEHAETQKVRKIVSIHMQIGILSDIQSEWLQRYFDYLSKGTIAEGALLKIEKLPAKIKCNACNNHYEKNTLKKEDLVCPTCGEIGGTLLSGGEYFIKEMEAI